MSRAATRMNRVNRLARHLTLETHHVPWDTVGMYAQDAPRSVCGAHVGPSEIALHGIPPTCPECKTWLADYERLQIQ